MSISTPNPLRVKSFSDKLNFLTFGHSIIDCFAWVMTTSSMKHSERVSSINWQDRVEIWVMRTFSNSPLNFVYEISIFCNCSKWCSDLTIFPVYSKLNLTPVRFKWTTSGRYWNRAERMFTIINRYSRSGYFSWSYKGLPANEKVLAFGLLTKSVSSLLTFCFIIMFRYSNFFAIKMHSSL